jgi:hypothetical protein
LPDEADLSLAAAGRFAPLLFAPLVSESPPEQPAKVAKVSARTETTAIAAERTMTRDSRMPHRTGDFSR